jgi:hypothetical protein
MKVKEKQALIPFWLLNDIVDLLDRWDDISSYPENVKTDYEEVMHYLIDKLARLKLHESYSQIFNANDDELRYNARIEYLKRKHYLHLFNTRA